MREDMLVRIGATDQALRQQLAKTERTAREAGGRIGRDLGSSIGAGFRTAGAAALKFATALAVVGAAASAAVRASARFGAEMAKIEGLVGVARDEVARMGQEILELAPRVGRSPQELAEALFFITSAGLTGSDAMDVLKASAKAATAGLGETKSVADALTSAMNAYASSGLSAETATDVLVATVREGKLEASELAGAIGQVLAVAENAGVRFDEVGASVAALTRVGIGTSEAVTGLRAVLSALARESKEGAEILDGMGTSFDELRQSIKERGLLATLVDLRARVGDNDTALVKILGSVEAVNTVLALTGANADQVAGIFGRMTDTTGALDDAFGAAADTVQFQMDRAMSGLNASMIAFGDALSENKGPLTFFADQMERLPEIIRKTAFLLNNLSATLDALNGRGTLQFARDDLAAAEADVARIRAELDAIDDPDRRARVTMTSGLSEALERLEAAQRALRDAEQRAAAVIRGRDGAPINAQLDRLQPRPAGVAPVDDIEIVPPTEDDLDRAAASREQEVGRWKTFFRNLLDERDRAAGMEFAIIQRQRFDQLDMIDDALDKGLILEEEAARARLMVEQNTQQQLADLRAKAREEEIAAAREEAKNKADASAKEMERVRAETERVMEKARELGMTFGSAFEDAIVQGNDLRDVLRGLLQDITRIFLRQQVTGPLTDALGAAFASSGFSIFHKGGMVGGPAPMRTLPTAALIGAPRLHNGLAPDEFPAILQKGEEVIPKGGRGGGNSYFIDARGADAGAVVRMERALQALAGPGVVERRAVGAVQNQRRRSPGSFA